MVGDTVAEFMMWLVGDLVLDLLIYRTRGLGLVCLILVVLSVAWFWLM